MEVFWSIEDADSEMSKKKTSQQTSKKLNSVTKEALYNNPTREKIKSVVRKRNEQILANKPANENATIETKDEPKKRVTLKDEPKNRATLKDLCAEDKQRVANLIRELARVENEKESALSQLAQQRASYEDQARVLVTEREKMKSDREEVEAQFKESQKMLETYRTILAEQQERKAKEKYAGKLPLPVKKSTFLDDNEERIDVVSKKDSSNFNTFPSFGSGGTIVKPSIVHRLETDVVRGHTLPEGYSSHRTIPTTSSTIRNSHSNVIPGTDGRRTVTNVNPIVTRRNVMTGPLSRPDLSSTRCSEYSDEEFVPGICASKDGTQSVVSGNGNYTPLSDRAATFALQPNENIQRVAVSSDENDICISDGIVDEALGNLFVARPFGVLPSAGIRSDFPLSSDRKNVFVEDLLSEQRRLKEVLQNQELFLKKQEQELRLLYDAQRLSSSNIPGLETNTLNGREFVGHSKREASTPAESVTCDHSSKQHVSRSVSVGTSPVKFIALENTPLTEESLTSGQRKTSAPTADFGDRPEPSQPTKFQGQTTEAPEGEAKVPRKVHQSKKTSVHFDSSVAFQDSSASYKDNRADSVRVFCENDSDSSLEESKIIGDLFFVK